MKRCFIIMITLLMLFLTSCESVSSLAPKDLASDTQNTVEQVEVKSNDVFDEIQRNIDLVSDLRKTVEQARIDNKPLSLDQVIRELQKVTESYEKLSGNHESIRLGLLRKISAIEDMRDRIDSEIAKLRQKRAEYYNQLQSVSDPNPDIVRTRKESLTQAIKYVDSQIRLWQDFNSIENNITAEMSNVQKRIDSFLNVIDSSAIVFREGLNLLELQKNINDALSLFTQDLPRMEQLSQDMERSWANLDYLVTTLTSISATELVK